LEKEREKRKEKKRKEKKRKERLKAVPNGHANS